MDKLKFTIALLLIFIIGGNVVLASDILKLKRIDITNH